MFLSIITINRNNAAGLKKTLDSVASQSCRDFEHIIIDGASTDNSVEVIKEYVASPAGKNVSYWVSEADSGVYNAMNKGIKYLGNSDYVLFLNSGDWLVDENVIKREAECNHAESIIYFDAILVKNKIEKILYPDKLPVCYFLCGSTLNHQNELIKTSLQKDNLYNENLKIFADNEFNIKSIIINKESVKHSKNTLSYYDANYGISSNVELFKKEQHQVLLHYFGKDIVNDYQLLNDYETGYFGVLKFLRYLLNKIAIITFRRR
ncbi:MAG: glycosyltransferase [Treponema sp.]|nr:glycosyltransferase [Treponema sp.]